jgi:ubiquinone/menaquinone biosynthesis C-methylase UbiE
MNNSITIRPDIVGKLRRVYDRIAQQYDDNIVGNFAEIGQKEESSFVSLISLHRGGRILDVASGTGRVSCSVAAMFNEVYAIDVSEEMLKKQKEKSATLHNIRLVCADCIHLPFGVEFDSICCMGMFDYYCKDEAAVVLEECRRVIKRPGWLTFSVQDKNAEGIINYVERSSEELEVPIFLYTENDVLDLCGQARLEIKKLQSVGLQIHIHGRW